MKINETVSGEYACVDGFNDVYCDDIVVFYTDEDGSPARIEQQGEWLDITPSQAADLIPILQRIANNP